MNKKMSYKPLSQVTEEDARAIIKAGYPNFFGTGVKWQFEDTTQAIGEPSKKLWGPRKAYIFWFMDDCIDIDLKNDNIDLFEETLFTTHLVCYTKAYELGYYVKEINDLIVNLQTKK